MSLPGLARDTATLSRRADTVDDEGSPSGSYSELWEGRGTWGSPRSRDLERAAQRGEQIDAVFAVQDGPLPELGDRLTTRGEDWEVVGVQDVRTHARWFLRRHTP